MKIEPAGGRQAPVTRNLKELLALGDYSYAIGLINESNFGTKVSFGSSPKKFSFDPHTHTRDIVRDMGMAGYRPARIGDILRYGAMYPAEQLMHPIVALDAAVDGPFTWPACIVLTESDGRRVAIAAYRNDDWEGKYCFLGVRMGKRERKKFRRGCRALARI